MKRHWRWFIWGAGTMCILFLGLVALGIAHSNAYSKWAVFEMKPVCRDNEHPDGRIYSSIYSVPTAEYWGYAVEWLDQKRARGLDIGRSVAVADGKIYLSLRETLKWTWPFREYDKDFDFQQMPFQISMHAAENIFEKRIGSGDLTIGKMMRFKLDNGARNTAALPQPYSCDFMGELILFGGAYASE